MASDWNVFLERGLAANLTVQEFRLYMAIGRLLLGWRKRSDKLGTRQLRELARLHGRSFERAREGLVAKGLLRFEPGSAGRGHGGTYELLLAGEMPAQERTFPKREKPARERTFSPPETPAEERTFPAPRNVRGERQEMPAVERTPIGSTRERTTQKTIATKAVEAYVGAGGSLEANKKKDALARQATNLAKKGVPERTILAAASDLGRRNEFPGYLIQEAEKIARDGGPCRWAGMKLAALTPEQLSECSCANCAKWRVHHLGKDLSAQEKAKLRNQVAREKLVRDEEERRRADEQIALSAEPIDVIRERRR